MGHQAIPLSERRCTTCGRGVDEGAQFRPRPRGGPHSHFAICRDCDNARVRFQTQLRRARAAEAEPPSGRVATGGFLERWEGAE